MQLLIVLICLLVLVVLALIAAVVIRTLTFKSKQTVVKEQVSYPIEKDEAAGRLAESIRIKTIFDVDLSLVDYATFRKFHEFLEKAFPLVHAKLEKKVINEYGLLYIWKGGDPGKKPVLLMAHQDVVPAADQGWKYPPFAGAIGEGYIWGRGTMDDKGSLMATMEAVEFLLKAGYQPSRSIYLSFGFDEEVGGTQGADKIAEYLKSQGTQFEYIIDEGQAVVKGAVPGTAKWVALIGTAEKGFVSLELSAEQAGGHAAAPPPQTAVGIVANAVAKVQNNLFPIRITEAASGMFDYIGPEMPFSMKMIFANKWLFGSVIKKRLMSGAAGASYRTTTAPTMMSGSPRDNVLAQRASAVINFRILQGDSIQSVTSRVKRLIADPRVSVAPFGPDRTEPSPVASATSPTYGIVDRTIREVLRDVLVTPNLVQGKTDSSHYTGLSDYIYRFVPERLPVEELASLHGYNERVSVNNYAEMITFYIRLLHNSCD